MVCSLRDILVSKKDADKRDERVCQLINHYFDLVMVHSDPSFQRFEDSFSRADSLSVPVEYTGYVVQPVTGVSESDDLLVNHDLPTVVASIGGGRVGIELLRAAVDASRQLVTTHPHQMLVFAGPFADDAELNELRLQAGACRCTSLWSDLPNILSAI